MAANDIQVGGAHYKSTEYQHWDYAIDTGMNGVEYALTKYATRYKSKNGRQDLEKAVHCAQKLVELASGTQPRLYCSGALSWRLDEWPLRLKRYAAANALSPACERLFHAVGGWSGRAGALQVLAAAEALLAEWDAEHTVVLSNRDRHAAEDAALPPDGEGSDAD